MAQVAVTSARVQTDTSPDPRGIMIQEGMSYPDDHPVVLAYPHLFVNADEYAGQVEQATARPGELRRARRG